MRIMAEELGLRRRLVIPVPVLTPRLSSYWIQLITPLSNTIASPLAEGLKNPVVCRDNRIASLIPQELLAVRAAIQGALSQVAEHHVETSWSMAGPIPGDPDWAGGTVFRDVRQTTLDIPDWAVFRAVCRVGGGNGWYATDILWKIRGWIDQLVGGPGLRRGRRDSEVVGYGEALDFWRVESIEPDRLLRLAAEMKVPGRAWLQFEVEPDAEGSVIRQTAIFDPAGLAGLLYWYSLYPMHRWIFAGMLRRIGAAAEELVG